MNSLLDSADIATAGNRTVEDEEVQRPINAALVEIAIYFLGFCAMFAYILNAAAKSP